MGSTSTSHSATTRLLLRLVDSKTGSSGAFSLHAFKEGAAFEMATEGAVHENYSYYVELLSEVDLGAISLIVSVNGDEPVRCAAPRSLSTMTWGGRSYWYYRCDLGDSGWKMFKSSYGFAVVEVNVLFADGRPTWALYTKDIPCICPFQDQEQAVSEMMEAISASKSDLASKWMFSGISPDAPSSALVDGGLVADSSQTLSGYLEFVDRVANSYEENLPYFRVRAHSRTLKRDEVIDPAYARKLGRRELIWMSRNAESMHRVDRLTGIKIAGSYYMAAEVQTERSVKSFDNDENRAVISFIKEISSSLRSVSGRVDAEVARLRAMVERLSAINSGGGTLLSRVIVEACIKREAPLATKAENLRRRCQGLVMAYERALPGVQAVRYRKPRRSKVFQEVKPYADIFSLMCIWPQFEGFDLVRDGLLLHTFKMDKLYEYFALLRILEWLADAGFVEDERCVKPITSYRYTHRSRGFSNEKQVANIYRLARGDVSLALYYQPVIYGDTREENGITLHRVSTTVPFSEDGRDSVWTPDFLIVLEGDRFGGKRNIVLDAKFRLIEHLTTNTRGEKGEYAACSFKYKASIASAGQERVDALWLLCGKATEPETYLFQGSSWASSGEIMMRDGVAALSPAANALDAMFAEMGVSKVEEIETIVNFADQAFEEETSAKLKSLETGEAPTVEEPENLVSETNTNEDAISEGGSTPKDDEPFQDIEMDVEEGPQGEQVVLVENHRDAIVEGSLQSDSEGSRKNEFETSDAEPIDGDKPAKRKSGLPAGSLAPEILDLVARICDLTLDKKALFHAGSSQENFGFQYPLLMKAAPSGKAAKLYTRERIEVAGEPHYVYSAWKPFNIQKLKNAVKSAEKAIEKSARNSNGVESDDLLANEQQTEQPSAVNEDEIAVSIEREAHDGKDAALVSPSEESSLPEDSMAENDDATLSFEDVLHRASPSMGKSSNNGFDDEVFRLVDKVVSLTFDKKSLYDSTSSQKAFGFQHPLLRTVMPSGTSARLYTRELVEVGGERSYVFSAWKPINVQKLKNTIRQLEKSSKEALTTVKSRPDQIDEVSPPSIENDPTLSGRQNSASEVATKDDAVRLEDLKRDAARKRTQLPDDSPFREEIDRSYRRVSEEWLQEKNKGVSFEEYALGKHATRPSAWWQGECGHKWRARLSERLADPLCPTCLASLKAQDKKAAVLFHRTKNGNGLLSAVAAGDVDRSCWWRCSKNHCWRESLSALRNRNYSCPECSGKE